MESDVDKVADIIDREFMIDEVNSIDKRKPIALDRFGYLSLHKIISLAENRQLLGEYKAFTNLKAEIQIRSILQHAWAEIEHDLGYKAEVTVPPIIKRKFYRLAGLLELADQEFIGINEELKTYQQTLPEKIENNSNAVSLDKESFQAFISSSNLVKLLDNELASVIDIKINESEHGQVSWVPLIKFWGINTIGDLEKQLENHSPYISQFAQNWLKQRAMILKGLSLASGISIFYLCYLLAGESQDPKVVHAYLSVMQPQVPEFEIISLIEAYNGLEINKR